MRSTPINALQIEANEPPLALRRQVMALKYILKLKSTNMPFILQKIGKLSSFDLIMSYWQKKNSPILCDAFRYSAAFDARSYKHSSFDISYFEYIKPRNVNFPSYNGQPDHDSKLCTSILKQHGESLIIFTDGSKTSNECGCAFYSLNNSDKKLVKLDADASVFTAEAIAILEALRYGATKKYKSVVIMSDSASVLQSISSCKSITVTNPVVLNIVKMTIDMEYQNILTSFYWVRGHTGIVYNEIVDKLAKSSCADGIMYEPILTNKELVSIAKQDLLYKEWENLWQTGYRSKMTQYAYIHPSIHNKPWYMVNTEISRYYRTMIARIKFGHGQYPSHLFKLKIIESPICQCGHDVADLNHILFNCSLHKDILDTFISNIILEKISLPTSIITLMYYNNKRVYDLVIDALLKMKIKI